MLTPSLPEADEKPTASPRIDAGAREEVAREEGDQEEVAREEVGQEEVSVHGVSSRAAVVHVSSRHEQLAMLMLSPYAVVMSCHVTGRIF